MDDKRQCTVMRERGRPGRDAIKEREREREGGDVKRDNYERWVERNGRWGRERERERESGKERVGRREQVGRMRDGGRAMEDREI